MSKDMDMERSRDRDRSRRGGGGGGGGSRFSSSNDRDRSPAERGGRDHRLKSSSTSSSNCRVYVSNIPYEYRWQDLKDLFREQVGEVSFVELFVDEQEKARGCGIVEFVDAAAAKKCLEQMHRFELKGRKIVIKEDYGNMRDKYGNLVGSKRRTERGGGDEGREHRRGDERRGASGGGGGSVGGGSYSDFHEASGGGGGGAAQIVGNTYGLSPAFLDDLNIQTPLISRVFVANLEYKVDKKKLKEVFRMAGKVVSVDMPVTKEGCSRGFAVIEYDHPVESVQAISMFNGHPLYERAMTVRMDRGPERDRLPDGLKTIGPGLGSNGEPLRDVARNLPSLVGAAGGGGGGGANSSGQQVINSGPGILGAVPNLQLNAATANALGSLSTSALNTLSSTSAAVLQQAANLGLSGNLLANADLNLLQNNHSLAVLAANPTFSNAGGGNVGGGGGGGSSFQSAHSFSGGGGGQNLQRNSYQSGGYESSKSSSFSFAGGGGGGGGGGSGGNDRDANTNTGNIYNTIGQLGNGNMRNNMLESARKKKLLISNLPPTASYKLVTEKCQEFGAVEDFEEQGVGSILVTFQTEWDAERAMKNIDRARVDGRAIDARLV